MKTAMKTASNAELNANKHAMLAEIERCCGGGLQGYCPECTDRLRVALCMGMIRNLSEPDGKGGMTA